MAKQREINSAREYVPNMTLIPSFSGIFVDNTILILIIALL